MNGSIWGAHVMDRISMRAAPPDKTVDILHEILQEF